MSTLFVVARRAALSAASFLAFGLVSASAAETLIDWGSPWEYTFQNPTTNANWNNTTGTGADGWASGNTPFGSRSSGDFKYQTFWAPDNFNMDDDLWIRRTVDLTNMDLSTIQYEMGVDNGFKMYVNGQLVTEHNAEEGAWRDEYIAKIPGLYLNSGINIIAFALEDHGGHTAFDLRLTGERLGSGGSSGNPGRLANISSRGRVSTGARSMIAGFVITGTAPRQVLIRGVGPSLAPFGLDALPDSRLELYQGQTKIAESDDWGSDNAVADNIANAAQRLGAFELARSSKDAAILTTLDPGSYSAQLYSGGTATGVGLVEVYDGGLTGNNANRARLLNISTRAHVGVDAEMLIAGFVVNPGANRRVLIRAVGPGLEQFDVPDRLNDPELRLLRGVDVVAANDDWSGDAITTAAQQAGAFALPAGSKDAVLLVTLPPGNYSAQVSGKNRGRGIALVEVYEVP